MGRRYLSSALIFSSISILILLTSYPPSVDLPQHLSQIQLLLDTAGEQNTNFVIQWAAPNTLIYYCIFLFWQFLPPELVAKAILIFLVFLWVAAIHFLAARRGSPTEAAILASLLIFNRAFYWGFLNFFTGFPVFVCWFLLTTREAEEFSWKEALGLIFCSYLLYASHALWFAAGVAWLVGINIVKKTPLKLFLFRLAALSPCVIASILWFVRFAPSRAASGLDVAAHWPSFLSRFSFSWLMNGAFGGLWGPAESGAFLLIYFWMAYLIWINRAKLRNLLDKDFLYASIFFLVIVLVGPGKYMNTIFFSSRWFPAAMIFLILAFRPQSRGNRFFRAIPLVIFLFFVFLTHQSWQKHVKYDLSGFEDSLAAIPPKTKVLGLDLIKKSEFIKGQPYLQLFSYAQAYKKCELNFSFAEHSTGIVAYKTKREKPWSKSLEWFGERVKFSDFKYFDYALINAEEKIHIYLSGLEELNQMTAVGNWRAYGVNKTGIKTRDDIFLEKHIFFPFSRLKEE